MLLIFLHYQHSFPQLAFPEKPCQQATFTPHPAKGTPECTEVSNYIYSDPINALQCPHPQEVFGPS